jgi:hypothetical protein
MSLSHVLQLASQLLSAKTVVTPTWDKDKILCRDVRLESSIWEEDKFLYHDHRQALLGQGHAPLIRCSPADLLTMGKGHDPSSCTSVGKRIAILREHRRAILGQGHVPSLRHKHVGKHCPLPSSSAGKPTNLRNDNRRSNLGERDVPPLQSNPIENKNELSFLFVLAGGHARCDNG